MLDLNIMVDLNMLALNMLDLNMLRDPNTLHHLSPLLPLPQLPLLTMGLVCSHPHMLLQQLPQVVGMEERATAATMVAKEVKEVKVVKAVKDEDMVAKGTVAVAKGGMVDMAVDMAKIQPLQLKAIKEKAANKEEEEQAIKENRRAINGLLIKGKEMEVVTAKMQLLLAPLM